MTDDRGGTEEPIFEARRERGRRESPLLARNPTVAILAVAVASWLLWDLSPDVSFFFSAREPIDLGGPGSYRLERARTNRLAQIRGELVDSVSVTEARSGAARTVGRIEGTNLVVDRPGRGGPTVFEGRLLPARSRSAYGDAVAVMRSRGSRLGDTWAVLRDGERPRDKWLTVVGSAILALLVLVNLRALAKRYLARG